MNTDSVLLRPARMEDAETLLKWRNDESTRRNFRNMHLVQRADHIAWLVKMLRDPGIRLRIAEVNGVAVGVIRSYPSDGYEELSYTVDPQWRGKGIAVQMALNFVREYLAGHKIQCEIKKGNVPSERVAQALGLCAQLEMSSDDPDDLLPLVLWR